MPQEATQQRLLDNEKQICEIDSRCVRLGSAASEALAALQGGYEDLIGRYELLLARKSRVEDGYHELREALVGLVEGRTTRDFVILLLIRNPEVIP